MPTFAINPETAKGSWFANDDRPAIRQNGQ
jgi:hypothetical protein